MVDTTGLYQIVVFTQHHSIAGGLFLHDQRVSDFLNQRLETTVTLRNSSIARLEEPAKILEKAPLSVIPKEGIVLVFEPPQASIPRNPRFVKYPKKKYAVFLATDGMEIHGQLHLPGPLDLLHTIINAAVLFLPITEATVTLKANPALVIKRDTVLVNLQRIRFLSEAEPKTPVTVK